MSEEDRGESPESAAEPVAQPPAQPAVRLARREENKVIAGVCSGIAAYTGTDPVLVRIGAVIVGLLSGGTAILAYVIAWLVMPVARPDEPISPPRRQSEMHAGRWIAIAVIVLGAVLLLNDIWHLRGGLLIGLVLVGLGVAFWGRDFTSGPPAPRPPMTPPPTLPLPPQAPPLQPPAPPGAAASSVPPSPRPRGSRPQPSILGRLVVGAAALAVAMALVLDNLSIVNVTTRTVFAVLLAIVGGGLLVGSWWGRARWLIFVGFGLALCLFTVSLVPGRGGFGEIAWDPASLREIDDEEPYQLIAGQAILDLSAVKFTRERHVDARVGFGQLLVIVPKDVTVEVAARVQGGEMNLFGELDQGWDVRRHITDKGTTDDGPIILDLRVTFGEITVRRVRAGDEVASITRDNGRRFDFEFRGFRLENNDWRER